MLEFDDIQHILLTRVPARVASGNSHDHCRSTFQADRTLRVLGYQGGVHSFSAWSVGTGGAWGDAWLAACDVWAAVVRAPPGALCGAELCSVWRRVSACHERLPFKHPYYPAPHRLDHHDFVAGRDEVGVAPQRGDLRVDEGFEFHVGRDNAATSND